MVSPLTPRTAGAVALLLLACASAGLVSATSKGDHEVLTCRTVKCKEGHYCKVKHGRPKCLRINPCHHHHCKRGHYCAVKARALAGQHNLSAIRPTVAHVRQHALAATHATEPALLARPTSACAQAGKAECVSKCTKKKCSEGKECKLKRGKARCVRQRNPLNPCAAMLCALGTQCVVENNKAECISVCASVRCGEGLECQPDDQGKPQCVQAGATNPCAFTTCLTGNFCQVENGQALCITNCATVKCAAGTRCETDPFSGNAACVPDGLAM